MLYALVCLLSGGLNSVIAKYVINNINRHRAIAYRYLFMGLMFFLFGVYSSFSFPEFGNIQILFFEILIGSVAVILHFKALDFGKTTVVSSVIRLSPIFVLFLSSVFFGEFLPIPKLFLSFFIVFLSFLFSLGNSWKIEKGVVFALGTAVLWGVYYSVIKIIVNIYGPFRSAVYLEIGITLFIWIYQFLRGRNLSIPDKKNLFFLFTSAFLIFILSISYNLSVVEIGASLTSVIVSASPLATAIYSRIFLGEKLLMRQYVLLILLVLSLSFLFLL